MRSFCGMTGGSADAEAVRSLSTMIEARPDGTGSVWQREDMLLAAEEGVEELRLGPQTWAMVFTGRLTNAEEVRWELLEQKHLLTGTSQEELVLHSYAQWGRDCVLHLRGGFAFAVWDCARRELFLARDPMGVQTLFWTVQQETLLFASELGTLLKCPQVPAVLDEGGAAELLLIGPGRTPGCGVLRGIQELEPGCTVLWNGGRIRQERYWRLLDGPHNLDFAQTSELIRKTVTEQIRKQTEPGPVGAFLSGGLDSGIVCAVCTELLRGQGSRLPTFSVDYEGNDRYFVPGSFQPTSDADFMGLLEQALGTDAHRVILTPGDLEAGLEDAVRARSLPGMGDVDISLLQFSREIRKTVPAVLSGECADELFGGYPWYRDPQLREQTGFPWARSTARRLALLRPGILSRAGAEDYIRSRYERTVGEADVSPEASASERRMKEMMNLNLRWFMQTLLERNRTMSAFAGLEIRSPFCDAELAQLLYRIPWAYKDHGGCEKGLLRHAFADLLPPEILGRKKSPYPKTHDPRFAHRMQVRMGRLLEDRSAPLWELVRREAVMALAAGEDDWPFYGQLMRTPQTLCYLLELDFWLRNFHVNIKL